MSDHEHTYGDDGMCTNCGAPHEAMVVASVIETPLIPPHIVEAMQVAEAPGVSAEDKEHAVEVLRAWDAAHAEPTE